MPQAGRHASSVLGLELAIHGGSLRFCYGLAELPGTRDLIGRLNGMVADLEARAGEAQTRIDEAAEQIALAEERALAGLRSGVLAVLAGRGISCSTEARARVDGCADPAELQRWLLRATTAGVADEVFA